MSIKIENIPDELKQRNQWILWRLEKRKASDEKPAKLMYCTNGKAAATNNPRTWASFQEALSVYQQQGTYNGLGFVFTEQDPFVGIDLDSDENKVGFACMHDSGLLGMLTDEAKQIIAELGSYAEYSQSGTGVHIIVKGTVPGDRKRIGNFEMYDRLRYFIFTGNNLPETPRSIEPRQAEVDRLYSRFFGGRAEKKKALELPPPKSPPMDDETVLSIARHAANREKFTALYDLGDTQTYHNGDNSTADQGLCNMLGYYTQDPEQIDRLFRESALFADEERQKKWERDNYRWPTIHKAIRDLTAWYGMAKFDSGDKGNAERLIHHFGPSMRYCPPLGGWLVWDGSRWKPDETEQATKTAMAVSESIERDEIAPIWNELTDSQRDQLLNFSRKDSTPEIRAIKAKLDGLRKQADRARAGNGIREMLNLAAPFLAVAADTLDTDQWLLNVENGTLNLRTGRLLPHDPDQLITKLAPVTFEPTAFPSLWVHTLNEIFRDENGRVRNEEIHFLQKTLGYMLTGSIQEHSFFIFHGRVGRNGKGTILNLMLKMLGDYATELQAGVLLSSKQDAGGANASPGIAKLKSMRLVLASETDKGRRLNEALIKGLTGGDPITARYLHKNEFTFMPEFKLFLQTNYMPAVDGSDAGLWDRLKKLDFLRYFKEEERDRTLPEKLWEERSGILNWLLEGCRLWQLEGLKETEEMRQSKQEFQEEMDAVPRYAREHLWIDPAAQVLVSVLYSDYELWSYENDEYVHKKREFYQRLETHMAKIGHRLRRGEFNSAKTARVHKGVGLKSEMPESWRKHAESIPTGAMRE